MLSWEYCEILRTTFFIEHLLTPIRHPHVTSEPENNEIGLQVKFTAFNSLRKI